jgi:phosphopentomutase
VKIFEKRFDRVIWVVLDGVGAGALPDADEYGDENSNTLGNLAKAFTEKTGRNLMIPHLCSLGLNQITEMKGTELVPEGQGKGFFGKAEERSRAKDTTSGHWEMAGLVVSKPFPTYPHGFSDEIVNRWVKENNLPGILGNKPASGTEIIAELGEEHLKTGKPIVYTSADSVWQIAAHEEVFGLERLYRISESARRLCDELNIGRVIARPFIGNPAEGTPFERTYNRRDYAQPPFSKTYLDALVDRGIYTLGLGKISSIYAGHGIDQNISTSGNADGIEKLLEQLDGFEKGLIFSNLIDFDMLYGHRRDVEGFGLALESYDKALPEILGKLSERDLLIMTADHGNDPTFRGTDHTREYIPILAYSPSERTPGPRNLGSRNTFADIGATIFEALTGENPEQATERMLAGTSFLNEID